MASLIARHYPGLPGFGDTLMKRVQRQAAGIAAAPNPSPFVAHLYPAILTRRSSSQIEKPRVKSY